MLKYGYYLKDKNYKTFSLVGDNREIEDFLKQINGVYNRLVWVVQKDVKKGTKKEYLIHSKNGVISEYALI